MDSFLEHLATLMSNHYWFAPLIALISGILTSFTPCSLSTIPLVIGYVGGTDAQNPKKAFVLSFIFAVGSAVTFTGLGILAALAGSLIGTQASAWYLFLGVLMVLMALQTWGIYEIIPSSFLIAQNKRKGQVGAFFAGILGGIFSSPCSTPILIALLTLVASKGNLAYGVLLLLLYSIGHGILAVIAGTSVGFVQKLSQDERYGRVGFFIKIFMGGLILFMGFYMFYLGF